MQYLPPALEALTEQFARLPGIGVKSAQRLAFYVLNLSDPEAEAFAQAILNAKHSVTRCPVCQNLTEGDGPCALCASHKRDHSLICVVADPKDVIAMERSGEYNGVYHVLHGVISPMNHVGPDDLRITELVSRVAAGGVEELIMATQPGHRGRNHRHVPVPSAPGVWCKDHPAGLWHPGGQSPGVRRRRHLNARPGGSSGDVGAQEPR